jgi:hypothetical protein
MQSERKPKAYSYTRFSTPEQAKGDSGTRQALAAERWAKERGIELDNELTLRDEGISAFDGLNVERGALGAFLRAVQTGEVPRPRSADAPCERRGIDLRRQGYGGGSKLSSRPSPKLH